MATPFLGLRTCIYRVPDMAAAAEWYTKALGIQPYFNGPFYVCFNVGGYELGLHPLSAVALAETGPSSAKATAGKGENIETYWGVEDIQATYAHFLTLGATGHEAPNNVGGELWVAMLKDPWGNIIGIIHNPEFKAQ